MDPSTAILISGGIGAATNLAGLFAGGGDNFNRRMSAKNAFDALYNPMQVRVTDAHKAGISPLAAIGAGGVSYAGGAGSPRARRGGLENVAGAARDIADSLASSAVYKERSEARKAQAETDAIRQQSELQRLEYLRRANASGQIASAAATAGLEGKAIPMYVLSDTTRPVPGKGQAVILNPEVAEGMEGAVPGTMSGMGVVGAGYRALGRAWKEYRGIPDRVRAGKPEWDEMPEVMY